ncbi:PPA1309 family protein [Skermania piniformis]|uniref:Uncharacterized protein n=1 Tax=Skermania pinensis TaxID=39122 RepID=A0ABX8S6Q2_9ACTN|nr:PPA1309 family protein [Skermania piniformis]QXQ12852.1 hypothetical protein KV203_13080 [Skermania piniformis]
MTLAEPQQRALARCVREVAEFVGEQGWDRPPQLFALVPTAELVAAEPSLAAQLADAAPLTPIAQEPLPAGDRTPLDEYLATLRWPPAVTGCVLVQPITVLPPTAETMLDDALGPLLADPDAADRAARNAAQTHPDRRQARLFAGVLRDGAELCLIQLRPDAAADGESDLLSYPDLASGLLIALRQTLE